MLLGAAVLRQHLKRGKGAVAPVHAQLSPLQVTMARFYGIRAKETGQNLDECRALDPGTCTQYTGRSKCIALALEDRQRRREWRR